MGFIEAASRPAELLVPDMAKGGLSQGSPGNELRNGLNIRCAF